MKNILKMYHVIQYFVQPVQYGAAVFILTVFWLSREIAEDIVDRPVW